jgi:DNA-binding NarL/FixJ family response regulator
MVTILAGLAEFELAHQRQEALQRLGSGEAQADVARSFNVSQATISRLAAA